MDFDQTWYVHWFCGDQFGIANEQISLSAHMSVFSFSDDNFSNYKWIFTTLGMCIDIVEIWFGIVNGQILSNFDSDLSTTWWWRVLSFHIIFFLFQDRRWFMKYQVR